MISPEFINDHKIKLNDNVEIRETDQYGIGVFLKVKNLLDSTQSIGDDRYELMRIPSDVVINVKKCTEYVQELEPEHRKVVNLVLTHYVTEIDTDPNETILITIMLSLLKVFGVGSGLAKYFQVLQETKIDTPYLEYVRQTPGIEKYYEWFPTWEKPERDSAIVELINSKLPAGIEPVTLQEFVKFRVTVRSRVLEIPESCGEGDDFVVNTSLVPVLDYVNHDNSEQNAWFDVDRNTGDVLLIYQHDKSHDSEIQVYISYTPTEDMTSFLFLYGFLPNSSSLKKFSLHFFSLPATQRKFCADFHVTPSVVFKLNFANLIPVFDHFEIENQFFWVSFADGSGSESTVWDKVQNMEELEIDSLLTQFVLFLENYLESCITQWALFPTTPTMAHSYVQFLTQTVTSFLAKSQLSAAPDSLFSSSV